MYSYASLSVEELQHTKFLPDNNTSLTLFLNPDPTVKDYFSGKTLNHRITFAGQYTIPVLYTPNEEIRIVNIDFLPWGAYSVLGVEQSALENETFDATLLFPNLQSLMPQIEAHLNDEESCVKILEEFLLTELKSRTKTADSRIIEACMEMNNGKGNIQVKDLCKQVGMSHSGFTNHFSATIGVTPKIYGRVARFTAAQSFLAENPNAGWTDLVHRFDYFDQNHFIREFKQFTGASPKDRRQWEAVFDPLKKAIEEGFETDAEQMKRYREAALYHIIHSLHL